MAERSPRWDVESNRSLYTLRERLAEAGMTLADDPDLPQFSIDRELFPVAPGLPPAPEELKRKVPICDTLRDLFAFPWADLLGHLPHPLWRAPPTNPPRVGPRPAPGSSSPRGGCILRQGLFMASASAEGGAARRASLLTTAVFRVTARPLPDISCGGVRFNCV